jgi:hypothetical protein
MTLAFNHYINNTKYNPTKYTTDNSYTMDYEHTCAVLTRGPKSGNQSRNESRMMLLSVVRSVILVAVPVARHEPRVTQ